MTIITSSQFNNSITLFFLFFCSVHKRTKINNKLSHHSSSTDRCEISKDALKRMIDTKTVLFYC